MLVLLTISFVIFLKKFLIFLHNGIVDETVTNIVDPCKVFG